MPILQGWGCYPNKRECSGDEDDCVEGLAPACDCRVLYGCSGPVCENNGTEAQWWWAVTGIVIVGMGVVTFVQLSRLLIKALQAKKLDRRDATSQCLVCCTTGEFFGIVYWFDIMWRRPFTCALGTTETVNLFTLIIPTGMFALFAMLSCITLTLMWYDETRHSNCVHRDHGDMKLY